MKLAFIYLVLPFLDENNSLQVKTSVSSIGRLHFSHPADRFILCPEGGKLFDGTGVSDGFSVEPVDLSNYRSDLFGCRQLAMLHGFHDRHPDYDLAVSIPSNWYLTQDMDITSAIGLAACDKRVFSVFFGGNPCAHVDRDGLFMLFESPFVGYGRLACRAYDVPGLDRLDCPSVVRMDRVSNLYRAKDMRLNDINRCGWDPSVDLVLYPDKLKCRWDDDKPEPFVDMVGIAPDLWDPVEIDKEG